MTAVSVEPRAWPVRRWLGVVTLIFIVQLTLIFGLGTTTPLHPRPAAATVTFRFAGQEARNMQAFNDPTLFTLPHQQKALAPAALAPPQTGFSSFGWSAPTNHLSLPIEQLGIAFSRLVETSDFNSLQVAIHTEAAPTLPPLIPLVLPAPRSTVQFEGALAQRGLVTPLDLKSQTNRDILTNTVVQVGVDAEGLPVSVTLFSGSGSADADHYGLEQAWTARFTPAAREPTGTGGNPTARTSWGKMIFRWHTVPEPAPSAPAPSP